ncbi:MAG: hypothetical protein O2820_04445 [Planctomycetota bacterium]|nr:hypothetical protein [Planctomycetota bacterium]MDA1248454.1 hypothetical protein [Planctomycetota bacterium]
MSRNQSPEKNVDETASAKRQKKATRKKKTSQTKASAETHPASWTDRLLAAAFRPALLLWVGLAGAAFVIGPSLLNFLPDLTQRDEYRLATSQIQIPDPPRWVPVTLLDQVIEEGSLPDEVSVLDEGLAEQIAAAFKKHPWVQGEVTVKMSVPARIEVAFEYRQPVAMVEVLDGFYAVDDAGVLLPPRDFPESDVEAYPRIVGMATTPLAGIGSTWGDARVIGASRIAVALTPWWRDWKLKSIVVPARLTAEQAYDKLEFVVTTQGGSRIIWGRPPGNEHPLEIADEEKIKRLRKFITLSQKGETLKEPWEVNINHLMEITYRPLPVSKAF